MANAPMALMASIWTSDNCLRTTTYKLPQPLVNLISWSAQSVIERQNQALGISEGPIVPRNYEGPTAQSLTCEPIFSEETHKPALSNSFLMAKSLGSHGIPTNHLQVCLVHEPTAEHNPHSCGAPIAADMSDPPSPDTPYTEGQCAHLAMTVNDCAEWTDGQDDELGSVHDAISGDHSHITVLDQTFITVTDNTIQTTADDSDLQQQWHSEHDNDLDYPSTPTSIVSGNPG